MHRAKQSNRSTASPMAIARILLLLLPLALTCPVKASAYADPGTGAFVYQAVYAAFLGGSFYLRRLLDRFYRRTKGEKVPALSTPNQD